MRHQFVTRGHRGLTVAAASFLLHMAAALAPWLYRSLSEEERLLFLIVHVLGIHRTLPGVVSAD